MLKHQQPPLAIPSQAKFHTFVPSVENSVVLIDSYTYNSIAKMVSQIIVKMIKTNKDVEEKTMDKQVLIEDTFVDPIATTTTSRTLA